MCARAAVLQVRADDVQLPEGATFVVANSLTVSKKAETADRRCVRVCSCMTLCSCNNTCPVLALRAMPADFTHMAVPDAVHPSVQLMSSVWVAAAGCRYNLRVVECRLAAMVLAVALGKAPSEAVAITTLKEVEPLIIDKYGPGAEAQDKAVREHLHEGVYMPDEVGPRCGTVLRLSSFLVAGSECVTVQGEVLCVDSRRTGTPQSWPRPLGPRRTEQPSVGMPALTCKQQQQHV